MDQQAGTQSQGRGLTRPDVLSELSETQLDELENQYNEGDREGFNVRADAFGWTPEQAEAVWAWFGAEPDVDSGAQGGG